MGCGGFEWPLPGYWGSLLAAGVGTSGWAVAALLLQASIDGSAAYLRVVEGVVLWHPSPPGGFFGQAGLGLGRIRDVFTIEGTTVRAAETGLSVMVG